MSQEFTLRPVGRLSMVAATVLPSACRSPQPAAVNPANPEIVTAVEAMLDEAVAAASAVEAEGVLSAATRDETFTFITGDTILTGYADALDAFRKTYALLQGQTNHIIQRRTRVLSPDVVLVWAISEGTYTDKAGFTTPPVGMGSTVAFVRRGSGWRVIHYHQPVSK